MSVVALLREQVRLGAGDRHVEGRRVDGRRIMSRSRDRSEVAALAS